MCGITGFLEQGGLRRDWAVTLGVMTDALHRRGPDERGQWADEAAGAALGHRRLSVVELTCLGSQPMRSDSGRYALVYNGEIYNFGELRSELSASGAVFHGGSDTEVLLTGAEHWGILATVERAVGMFAFALWDRGEQRLWLGRDRLGEKPLYCGWLGATFLFGSELKALREHPAWRGGVDRNALAAYMRRGYVPGPHSIHPDIRKVTPGEVWEITPQSPGEIRRHTFWAAGAALARARANPFSGRYEHAVDAVDAQLRATVGKQMIADVPLGAFLSGGIDSSLIVAEMQAQSARPVRTFTIGYSEEDYDEAAHARAVARHLGTEHTELRVTPADALAVVPHLPEIYDEPFADASQIPVTLVAALARGSVTVALSGDGGDELFAGYNRYRWAPAVWGRIGAIPRAARSAAAGAMMAVPARVWDRGLAAAQRMLHPNRRQRLLGDKVHKLAGVLGARSPADMFLGLTSSWPEPTELVAGALEPAGSWDERVEQAGPRDFASRMMFLDTTSYLPDDILVKVDRAAMSVGLETRAPFLDHRMFDLAWRLPLEYKLDGRVGKRILRDVLGRYVPSALFERPKMGFGVPIEHWLRGPLREWADDLLSAGTLRSQGYLNVALVRRTWHEHLSGARNWQYRLWIVLMFQAWLAAHPGA